jgi:hypothetical protein
MSIKKKSFIFIAIVLVLFLSNQAECRLGRTQNIRVTKLSTPVEPIPASVSNPSPPTKFFTNYYDNTDSYTLRVRDKNHLRVDGISEFLQTVIVGGPVNGVGWILTSNVSVASPINTLPASDITCTVINFGPFNQPFYDFSNATFDGVVAFGSGNAGGVSGPLLATTANQYSNVQVKSALGEAFIKLWLWAWGDIPAAFLSSDPRAPGYFNIFDNTVVEDQDAFWYEMPPFGVTCASPFGNRIPTKEEMTKLMNDLNVRSELVRKLFGSQ